MTPQQAYEKRYAAVDGGRHTWDAAPPHVKDLWLAAWTIAWAIGEQQGREYCATLIESTDMGALKDQPRIQSWIAALLMGFAKNFRAMSAGGET